MKELKNIEVEFRSIFDKKKYNSLKLFLDKYANNLGVDDKDSYYYLIDEKVIKVVNNISQKTAKIVMKLNRVGTGDNSTEEIEIFIDPKDVLKGVKLFSELKFDEVQKSFQKRINYKYKEVVLELKYSESWGYHMELEIMISDIREKKKAEEKIFSVAEELGIDILSKDELKKFINKINQSYKK